jgi:hypothetical protein
MSLPESGAVRFNGAHFLLFLLVFLDLRVERGMGP